MPVLLLLLVGPLVAALALWPLRRWAAARPVAAVMVLLLMGGSVAAGPLGAAERDTLLILGQALTWTAATRAALLWLYGGLGVLFLLSLFLPSGEDFVPLTLAALAPLSAVLLLQPFVYGALLLLVAAAGLAVVIQAGRAGSTRAALRYLIMTALAVPLLLVAGWMLAADQQLFAPTVWRLLLIGLAVLLAGFPFYLWVLPIAEDAPPLVAVLVLSVVQGVVVLFAVNLLAAYPWLQEQAGLLRFWRWSGLATAAVGGLLAFSARRMTRLLGCLALIDMGAGLVAFSGHYSVFSGQWSVLASILVARFVGLAVAGVGLALMRRQPAADPATPDRFAARRGLAWQSPLPVALYFLGCFSLAGLPLTPGFAGRWAVVTVTAGSLWGAAILLLAAAGATVALLRGLACVLSREAWKG